MSESTAAGLSRRDVIKKGALVGGLVWAAPVVTKVTPAFGQTSPLCACPSGTTLYRRQFTIGAGGTSISDGCAPEATSPDCEPVCWDSAVCDTNYKGNRTFGISISNGTITITYPAGATPISDSSNCPSTAPLGGVCVAGTPGTANNGRHTRTYTGCEAGEVINVVYCL